MSSVKDLAYQDYKTGMKYKDIANKHGVSLSAVKSWASREWKKCAVKKLQPESKKVATNEKRSRPGKEKKSIDEALCLAAEENERLTDKQRLFCLCYIKSFNATQAAINAGYSPDTAAAIGYENLIKPHIRNEIYRLKEIKAQGILLSQDDIVERYMRIAFADMTDFAEWGAEWKPVMGMFGPVAVKDAATGESMPLMEEVNFVRFKDSTVLDGGLVCEVSQGKNGVKIKLGDRQRALDWLSRYFLMNPLDKHRIDYDNKKHELEQQRMKLDTAEPEIVRLILERREDGNNTNT